MPSPSDAFSESLLGDFMESKVNERINGRICPPYNTYRTSFSGGFDNTGGLHQLSGDCLAYGSSVDFFDCYFFIGCQPGIYRLDCSFQNPNPTGPTPDVQLIYQHKPQPFDEPLVHFAGGAIRIGPIVDLPAGAPPVEFSFEWPMIENCSWDLYAKVSINYAAVGSISAVRLHR